MDLIDYRYGLQVGIKLSNIKLQWLLRHDKKKCFIILVIDIELQHDIAMFEGYEIQ